VNRLRALVSIFVFMVASSVSTVSIADQTIRLISTEMSAGLLSLENNKAEGIYPDFFAKRLSGRMLILSLESYLG